MSTDISNISTPQESEELRPTGYLKVRKIIAWQELQDWPRGPEALRKSARESVEEDLSIAIGHRMRGKIDYVVQRSETLELPARSGTSENYDVVVVQRALITYRWPEQAEVGGLVHWASFDPEKVPVSAFRKPLGTFTWPVPSRVTEESPSLFEDHTFRVEEVKFQSSPGYGNFGPSYETWHFCKRIA